MADCPGDTTFVEDPAAKEVGSTDRRGGGRKDVDSPKGIDAGKDVKPAAPVALGGILARCEDAQDGRNLLQAEERSSSCGQVSGSVAANVHYSKCRVSTESARTGKRVRTLPHCRYLLDKLVKRDVASPSRTLRLLTVLRQLRRES